MRAFERRVDEGTIVHAVALERFAGRGVDRLDAHGAFGVPFGRVARPEAARPYRDVEPLPLGRGVMFEGRSCVHGQLEGHLAELASRAKRGRLPELVIDDPYRGSIVCAIDAVDEST